MKKNILLVILFTLGLQPLIFSQDDIQIGNPYGTARSQLQGGLFDYSDPSGINIKVQLWGYVRYPGYYIVPAGSTINELISLAGGPTEEALLTDLRVLKIKEGSQTTIRKYNYNNLMWDSDLDEQIQVVDLQAGDVVIVPGEPRYFLRQDISFYLSIVTTLASLAALIISITNN